jgi:hypothetical protein
MESFCKKQKQLESFQHSTIRRILNIRWEQVRNARIRNKQVRFRFFNIPKLESFITKRTATYIGKVTRSEELPKKILGAWMHQPRNSSRQQLLCSNNFARAISAVVPNITPETQDHPFKKWIPLMTDEEECGLT